MGMAYGNESGRPATLVSPTIEVVLFRTLPESYFAYLGVEGDSTVILPLIISALMASSSFLRPESTFDSNLWNGAMLTPPFSSVPT